MNAKTNDGGPAFPMVETVNSNAALCDIHHPEAMIISTGGMSLRAWLAGQSIGAAARLEIQLKTDALSREVARRALEIADDVIAELEKDTKPTNKLRDVLNAEAESYPNQTLAQFIESHPELMKGGV